MAYTFTHEQRQKGGWARARQHADYRRSNPSPAEAEARQIAIDLGYEIFPEYEIATEHFPQWIDILAVKDGRKVAIEIDGSHGWHGYDGFHSKMAFYDETKAQWCNDQGIELIYVPGRLHRATYLRRKLEHG